MTGLKKLYLWIGGVAFVGGGLALLDPMGSSLSAWFAYIVLCALCAFTLFIAWRRVTLGNAPPWLVFAIGSAITVRLLVGIGFNYVLPIVGYETRHQKAGYFFPDAYSRDRESWRLADSGKPLTSAFTASTETDQYGGLVFLSAAIYRGLCPEVRRPILVLVLTAMVSALAVLFTWGFANIAFNSQAAAIAAWGVALYPEAVLLGASQMREPFLIMGIALTLFGYALARIGSFRSGVVGILMGVLLTLFISPPFGVLALGIVGTVWLWESRVDWRRTTWVLVLLALLALVTMSLVVKAWSEIQDSPTSGVGELLSWWISAGARYELHKLVMDSGMVQHLFSLTPEWAHIPMATGNGLVQPFLPAALMDNTGTVFARVIVIWRSVGWFALLPFLIYAFFAALRRVGLRKLQAYLALLVWGTALLTSYRAAGDQWDNVRYRAVLLAAQTTLAGWAWTHSRRTGSPWLRRTIVVVVVATLLFIQWYAGRYYHTPSLNLYITLSVLGVFIVLYLAGVVFLDLWRARQVHRLTGRNTEV